MFYVIELLNACKTLIANILKTEAYTEKPY